MNESNPGDSIARRRGRDRPRDTVRNGWLDDGLSGSMYGWVEPLPEGRRRMDLVGAFRAFAGVMASAAGCVVIPAVGLVGGFLLPFRLVVSLRPEAKAEAARCGNDALIAIFPALILGLVGLVAGVFLASLFAQYALVMGLQRNDD